ncbi:50S ribosomal protein L23 [Rhabdochlamydiaceae symbiont of Dictyostelium giganteum]|uniref:50S ribosomal protein L23 n=1 Tax=Rhabdochlamydiaceae symbiont of Dictyostelium giganteum TaxID=3342349 RepID=UPI00384F5568
MRKDPYEIIESRYVTEKSRVLGSLHTNSHNPSVKRCDSPKYVFLVDKKATKLEIAHAVEEIYKEQNIQVTKVNTIIMKPKPRTVRGRKGMKKAFKKAVVTLKAGDVIGDKE